MKSKLLYLLLCLFIFGFQAEMYAQFNAVKTPEKLGGTVNTEAEESMPIFDKESSTLFFVRSSDENSIGGKNDQDVWKSEKEEDFSYSKGASVKELNNKYNNSIVGINKEGNRVYLLNSYEGKKDLKKGISVSVYKGKKWDKPKEIKIPNLDIEGGFYGFHINSAEDAIIISYFGSNSKGKEDLYVSIKDASGKWSEPLSMGENINSTGFEISPYLSPNDDTLFFSSDGFSGSGDADIFYSVRTGESWSDWSKPINIGSKINSPKFDAYFTFSGNNFYWSSNRDNKLADIYYTTIIPPLFADITSTDVTFFKGSDGTVSLSVRGGVPPYSYNWTSGQQIEDLTTVPKGIYSVTVTDSYGQQISLSAPVNEPKLLVELTDAIIYFDRQSSYLNPQNKKELEDFSAQLKDLDATLKFEVISHCDSRSSDEYNMWLGERRMNRTIDYLVSQGIDRSRFKGDFKGENQPDVKCESCTEPQFTLNRRTTIKVIRP
jgi:outer membrane protein OmpA-like peptidoglycan-associated protein/uncharacterized protein YneR